MPNNRYYTITVTGVGDDLDDEIVIAHRKASAFFESDLISPMTGTGHNFINSFCIFPSGSGFEREPEIAHRNGIIAFCKILRELRLDFFVVCWSDNDGSSPCIIGSHDELLDMNKRLVL